MLLRLPAESICRRLHIFAVVVWGFTLHYSCLYCFTPECSVVVITEIVSWVELTISCLLPCSRYFCGSVTFHPTLQFFILYWDSLAIVFASLLLLVIIIVLCSNGYWVCHLIIIVYLFCYWLVTDRTWYFHVCVRYFFLTDLLYWDLCLLFFREER